MTWKSMPGPGNTGRETDPVGGFDPTRPHPARVYQAWLGGKDTFNPDRATAAKVAEIAPWVVASARGNRAFLTRAVTHLTRAGISQVIDVGSGLPTAGNVHEIAQSINPDTKVVYVDNDPIVLIHARALLACDHRTIAVAGDARDPATILDNPDVRAHLDFNQPIAVLFLAVLHFLDDGDDPASVIAAFHHTLAPGSHIAISHVADLPDADTGPARAAATRQAVDAYEDLVAPFALRTPEQITGLFTGLHLIDPGVVPVHLWHPARGRPGPTVPVLGGIGRVRDPSTHHDTRPGQWPGDCCRSKTRRAGATRPRSRPPPASTTWSRHLHPADRLRRSAPGCFVPGFPLGVEGRVRRLLIVRDRRAVLVASVSVLVADVFAIVVNVATSDPSQDWLRWLHPLWRAWALVGVLIVVGIAVVVRSFGEGPARGPGGGTGTSSEKADAVVEYLALETLRYWRAQAKARRITTPSPVSVCWQWARGDVAVPAADLQHPHEERLLTEGVVTQLRRQLYEPLDVAKRRIVVLGGPGAGKTTGMLLLLIDVLRHRPKGSDEPVPVWLTLGGWNPDTVTLHDWVADTLARDYPGVGAPEHGGDGAVARLLTAGRLALFLDGLDEMPPGQRGAALEAIDRETDGMRVVLTSRPAEYEAALKAGRLYGAAVVEILPVEMEQAESFLLAEQLDTRRPAWQAVLDGLRARQNGVAARTLRTPLALSLARDAYATTGNPTELLDEDTHPSPAVLLQHLLIRFLILAYPQRKEREHALRWLSWVARRMGDNPNLRWWDIPTWSPRWLRGFVRRFLVGLAVGLMVGLMVGFAAGGELGPVAGFEVGALFGLVFGLVQGLRVDVGVDRELSPRRLDPGPWRRLKPAESGQLLGFGLLCVPLGMITFAAMFDSAFGAALGAVFGLLFGLVFGFVFMLVDLWSPPSTTAQTASPLEVFRSDRRRNQVGGFGFGLWIGLVSGAIALLFVGQVFGLAAGLLVGIVVGSVFGLGGGYGAGLGPAVELTLVEVFWALRGRRVRFIPLLQTALDRQVLRQDGAFYQFRHASLKDLLATDPLPEELTAPDR